ncbi:hypothetical protein SAMN05519103_02564 [Rhizobiales bacterium GAS113]|nr:hypothetical protein SAMN05519103_02564 [Rhizobiales bacterium GAS113]
MKNAMEPVFYEIKEFSATHKIGITRIYEEIKRGKLRAQKLGRKTLISQEAARAWRESLPEMRPA